jgi:hypothetical protein
MCRTRRVQYGAVDSLISVMAALLSFVVLTSTSVAAAPEAHPRAIRTAPRAVTRAVKPQTKAFTPDHDILIRLEKGQRALEERVTSLEAEIRQQVDQQSRGIEDSRKEAQQMLVAVSKRVKLTERLLMIVIVLLVALCGGSWYFAGRLTGLENKLLAHVVKPQPRDEQAVEWQEGKPSKG